MRVLYKDQVNININVPMIKTRYDFRTKIKIYCIKFYYVVDIMPHTTTKQQNITTSKQLTITNKTDSILFTIPTITRTLPYVNIRIHPMARAIICSQLFLNSFLPC